ncbi:alcohol dehydrogenase [Pedobacter yulinensis]|uniref:Alcohol dehydrogenase n=1 Tax=Pedobacter yulinensis TaxID=2126353 RepID=A0A2T3HHJ8_9SPHI|nr:aldo/keto reductase [Pedobacter yulinensis]PST81914.1 alcohol dehydrogenase [Pedobacter yulinensis]
MEKRQLGGSDLYVAPITFGGNVFGWSIDEKTSFEILDGFFDAGFNFIDTADVYSRWAEGNQGGESETIIGNWMKSRGNRHKVILATKVGGDMGQGQKDLSRGHIISAVEASLQRLQTDYIDLYQSHYDDPETPLSETITAFDELVRQGKVRWIGASNHSAERLKAAITFSKENHLAKYQTFQPEYNLFSREGYEAEQEKVCLEEELGVINYYALASGFLTGKYRSETDLSQSLRGGGIKKYLNHRGMEILEALDEVAASHGVSQASVALAWLIMRPSVTAPIASVTSLEQLRSFTDAVSIRLSAAELDRLNKASLY